MGSRAVAPKGDAKEDWAIIRALSAHVERVLPYDNLGELREKLFADHPTFAGIGYAPGASGAAEFDVSVLGSSGAVKAAPFENSVIDFYMTNPILRASNVMAECSSLKDGETVQEAAE